MEPIKDSTTDRKADQNRVIREYNEAYDRWLYGPAEDEDANLKNLEEKRKIFFSL